MSLADLPGTINGLRIYETVTMTIGPFEDWSKVRSPARAKRRRRKGYPQRIRLYYLPDPKLLQSAGAIYGHPETIRELKRQIRAREQ